MDRLRSSMRAVTIVPRDGGPTRGRRARGGRRGDAAFGFADERRSGLSVRGEFGARPLRRKVRMRSRALLLAVATAGCVPASRSTIRQRRSSRARLDRDALRRERQRSVRVHRRRRGRARVRRIDRPGRVRRTARRPHVGALRVLLESDPDPPQSPPGGARRSHRLGSPRGARSLLSLGRRASAGAALRVHRLEPRGASLARWRSTSPPAVRSQSGTFATSPRCSRRRQETASASSAVTRACCTRSRRSRTFASSRPSWSVRRQPSPATGGLPPIRRGARREPTDER